MAVPRFVMARPMSSPAAQADATPMSTTAVDDESSGNRASIPGASATCQQTPRDSHHMRCEKADSDEEDEEDEEFHDLQQEANYPVVTKSVFKEKKVSSGFFLSRLSNVKSKYVPTEPSCVVACGKASNLPVTVPSARQDKRDSEYMIGNTTDTEIVVEEEEQIQVSIELAHPSTDANDAPAEAQQYQRNKHMGVDESCVISEVVIHSGESDSDSTGYATLNPVIRRAVKGPIISISPAAAAATSSNEPCLLEIPTADQEGKSKYALIINALGATALTKVEKFGTQSSFLEMRLLERGMKDFESSGLNYSVMRTTLHKKGGSDAQWNQQFTTPLRDKDQQYLNAVVKTDSKIVVGEAIIPLAQVGALFYDKYFTLYRMKDDAIDNVCDNSEEIAAGQLHLQLKITECSSATVPTLHLPFPSVLPEKAAIEPLHMNIVPTVLKTGGLFYKVPYHSHSHGMGSSAPKRQWVQVIQRDGGDLARTRLTISWSDPTADMAEKSNGHCLDLALVTDIWEGHKTKAFERQLQSNKPNSLVKEREKCFSLVTKARTLDLVASSKEEAHIWVGVLKDLIFHTSTSSRLGNFNHSVQVISDFKQTALTPRDVTAANAPDSFSTTRKLASWRNEVFHYARRGMINEIGECLQLGCPIDLLENNSGDTLLLLACRLGNTPLVELCLSWRAKNDPHPEFGETAVQIAVKERHAECLSLLLKTAAKSDMDSEIVNHIDPQNDAPLHVAARHGDLSCLQCLLHHGADICVVEEFGRTPLHCAVANGSLDCVAYLLDVGADSILNAGDHDGDTALHYAAVDGKETIVKLLLESAANVFAANTQNETPYDVALREKQQKCSELIAKYYLSNTKQQTCPALRNEPASALLQQMQMEYELDGVEQFQSKISIEQKNNNGICRPPLYDGTYFTGAPVIDRAPLAPFPRPLNGSQVFSPSAQVREALRRHQSQHTKSSASSTLKYQPTHRDSYSARELWTQSQNRHLARPAFTERIDREHIRNRSNCIAMEQNAPRNFERYQNQSSTRGTNHDASWGRRGRGHGGKLPTAFSESTLVGQSVAHSLSNQNDFKLRRHHSQVHEYSPTKQGAWEDGFTEVTRHESSPAPPLNPQWDMFFSDEGYPYYVNRATGISQWERPTSESPRAPIVSSNTMRSHDRSAGSLSADAIVRMRLEETRSIIALSVPTPSQLRQVRVEHKSIPPPKQSDAPTTSDAFLEVDPLSKYEARTGRKLSVDISSPIELDETRPVFVPSPRAKSPPKITTESLDTTSVESGGSFQKSRHSSPRGKTKHIQLIELKRGNNISIALSRFNVHNHYEQFVQGIVDMDEQLINAELLSCLQRYYPTEEETQLLRDFTGPVPSLGRPEKFFYLMLQVPEIQQRIEMFLYKLEFLRNHQNLQSRIQIVKQASRDLVENYSFQHALNEFFAKNRTKSFRAFRADRQIFMEHFLSQVDVKIHSFCNDLKKAANVELIDLQLQLNRLVAGLRSIQPIVEETSCKSKYDPNVRAALQRFIAEAHPAVSSVEYEYEVMGQWVEKVLELFGESRATCQLSSILHGIIELVKVDYQ